TASASRTSSSARWCWSRNDGSASSACSRGCSAARSTSRRWSRARGARPFSSVATEVIAHNEVAENYTVLDVITGDRTGVLFTITYTLHRLGLVIHLAKITTQVHQVFDVFYVTGADGAKVTDPERLAHVRAEIECQLRLLAGGD